MNNKPNPSSSVSVVIPSFNGCRLLKAHLPYVLECVRTGDEIVIVDDASRDGTVEWLTEEFGLKQSGHSQDYDLWTSHINHKGKKLKLSLVVNHNNLRFGGNSNRGVKVAQQPIVFLVNNDVSPHLDVIDQALPYFDDQSVFAVGCHEIEKNLGGISGGKNQLWFERGVFVHKRTDDFSTGDTAWASGGSAFFDREKWLKLKGFSPAFYPAYFQPPLQSPGFST